MVQHLDLRCVGIRSSYGPMDQNIPAGLEAMVGSVYSFFEQLHQVQPAILEENDRSIRAIVELAHEAGYDRSLTSYSPDMRTDIITPLPTIQAPAGWPQALFWTPEWASLLDPNAPVTCFVYPEGRSSQWNYFEADSVAALALLLYGRLGNHLPNERDPASGAVIAASHSPYTMEDFWRSGIGIVTPHRAQQALNESRFLILPDWRPPNWASRILALCHKRLPTDWRAFLATPLS